MPLTFRRFHQDRQYGLKERGHRGPAWTFRGRAESCLPFWGPDERLERGPGACSGAGKAVVEQGVGVLIPGGGIPHACCFSQLNDPASMARGQSHGIPIVVKDAELAVRLRELTGLGHTALRLRKPRLEIILRNSIG